MPAAPAAGAAPGPGGSATAAGSRALRLPLGQHRFHQVQAFVVAHLPPACNLGGGTVAAQAVAFAVKRAHADAGAEDGAEWRIHDIAACMRGAGAHRVQQKTAPACAGAAVTIGPAATRMAG